MLIEYGGLVVKAGLDVLDTKTLFGALISARKQLKDDETIINEWFQTGKNAFDKEQKFFTPAIEKNLKKSQRKRYVKILENLGCVLTNSGMSGMVLFTDINQLKNVVKDIKHLLKSSIRTKIERYYYEQTRIKSAYCI